MKTVTIKIIIVEKNKIIGLEIIGGNNESYDKNKIIEIDMDRSIYLGMLAEMKKVDICIDNDLKCLENRIFSIVEKEWKERSDDLKVEPIVFGISLRTDLEKIWNAKNN